jgi:hypothetical protein
MSSMNAARWVSTAVRNSLASVISYRYLFFIPTKNVLFYPHHVETSVNLTEPGDCDVLCFYPEHGQPHRSISVAPATDNPSLTSVVGTDRVGNFFHLVLNAQETDLMVTAFQEIRRRQGHVDAQARQLADLHDGRSVVLPKTLEHARKMYRVAFWALGQLEHGVPASFVGGMAELATGQEVDLDEALHDAPPQP